ncbi:MAG: glycosyltransferase [Sphingobacteriaceae bacterium]
MENTSPTIKKINLSLQGQLPKNLLCLSHLRWDFVYQRPQQLLSRLAKQFNVYFLEEPLFDAQDRAYLTLSKVEKNISVIVPHLPAGLTTEEQLSLQRDLLDRLLATRNLADFIFWYYTPMALEYADHLQPKMIVYDCMDELSAFKFAPANIKNLERKLFKIADLVFTGGETLYRAKKHAHDNIYPFPSSIDKTHFAKSRSKKVKTFSLISGIKLGYYGVIDERFDIGLIKEMAENRPNWKFSLVGPVVKIDPESLPKLPNIHYLGAKTYNELPKHLAEWDIALIPFLLNESTRFISPTKTPEYLAGGKPVISTPIQDVIYPYGINGLVKIGKNAADFIQAAEELYAMTSAEHKTWLASVDRFLMQLSWEKTCQCMLKKMEETLEEKLMISVA